MSDKNKNKVISFENIKGREVSASQNDAMKALREKMFIRKKATEIANKEGEFDRSSGLGL